MVFTRILLWGGHILDDILQLQGRYTEVILFAPQVQGLTIFVNYVLGMDMELAGVITAISKNKSLKHLSMGRNMNNMKAKHIATIMDSVVQVIQDEECILHSLAIPDSKLKSDLHNFLNALGDNKCLEMIDISGNLIGDSGARLLAKALQINNRLRTIICDRNAITLQGTPSTFCPNMS